MIQMLPISKISRRSDARALDNTAVSALAESIADVGLLNPIRCRVNGDGWEVVAGSHRLAACESLGFIEIEAIVYKADDLHAELAMIDENLCRAELSPSERARQTARRKSIYEEMHPETRAGVAGGLARQGAAGDKLSFADETSKATGRDARTVQRDAERGEKVTDEVLSMISGTKLDTGTYLDKLKKLTPNDQFTAAKRDLAILRENERAAAAGEKARADRNSIDRDVQARAAREVANIIAEHVPAEWWDALKANLYAAKNAAFIANELTNISGESIMDRRYGT
jgi:uncharacterized ParB-like nuclease family protein